jgi:hypothetical protein
MSQRYHRLHLTREIDVPHCTITLVEFRTLDRDVTFLGSFDENEQKR